MDSHIASRPHGGAGRGCDARSGRGVVSVDPRRRPSAGSEPRGCGLAVGPVVSVMPAARVDADADLVEALRREAPEAAELLVERFGDRVYRLALRITGVSEDAEEAAQDALWTAARKISTFKGEAAFGSWLCRIAANAAYQKLRARRSSRTHEIAIEDVLPAFDDAGRHFEPMDDWSKRVDQQAVQAELRRVLTDAIDALPPDYRTALVLRDVEGVSNPDIAEALNLSLPAVKSRVHRSRLFVRKRLSEYLGMPRSAECYRASS